MGDLPRPEQYLLLYSKVNKKFLIRTPRAVEYDFLSSIVDGTSSDFQTAACGSYQYCLDAQRTFETLLKAQRLWILHEGESLREKVDELQQVEKRIRKRINTKKNEKI